MYKRLLIVTFTVIGLCTLLICLPIHGEAEIYDSVLRLHVIANSDSEEDQALKLKVRDAILEKTKEIFCGCTTREEARKKVEENIVFISSVAKEAIIGEGYSYDVNVTLDEENYPTKNYESFCFPSGEYLSLRVIIGEGGGQNWWCVLFPPLCIGAASQQNDAIEVGLSGEQYNIITQSSDSHYKIRFKLLEAISEAID